MQNKIYFDIETIPQIEELKPEEIKAPANYKDIDKIKAYQVENSDIEYRKTALNSMRGRIVCIGCAINDSPVFVTDKISEFIKVIEEAKTPELIGHNILGFDLPFIFHQCLKENITFPSIYLQKNCSLIKDTMQMFNPWEYKSYYKLSDIAKFLSIPHNDDVDGSMVWDLYQQGKIEIITDHCKDDINTLREVYIRLSR